ncbi:MAG: rhodanese-like domain-containing protein [Geobacteraceae bacterium]|nr:rhodanese-like domain-containing protein [Geobacteraceae bacterium]
MKKCLIKIIRICSITTLPALAAVLITMSPVLAGTDFGVISTEQLKQFVDQKQEMILIDARTPAEYQEAHITGAINIPEKQFEETKQQLPATKDALLIFYCNGVKCGKSKRVAKLAQPLGYTNILVYSEGIPVWEEYNFPLETGPGYGKKIETAKLTPGELNAMIKADDKDFVLVDVRDEAEFRKGHIPTAICIPSEIFATKSDALPKEKKIIVYCNTGSRSYLAYKKLIGLAYPRIYQTLFADWKDASLPVAR